MRILISGPIGSGKTTQSRVLSEELGLKLIKAGELVREKATDDSPDGLICKKALEKGVLAPEGLVAKLVKNKIAEGAKRGFIFDAYPRSLSQIKLFDPEIKKVIYIKVSDEEVIKRLKLRQRDDDDPKTIKTRLKVYHQQTQPVLTYYKKQNKLIEIDGNGTVEEVKNRIKIHLSELQDKKQ